MSLACHLQIFANSENVLIINPFNHQKSSFIKEVTSVAKSFSDGNLDNFTLFTIINHDNQVFLYVVSKNDTVVKLHFKSMTQVEKYKIRSCFHAVASECDENVIINQLSSIELLENKMLWLCYFIPQNTLASPFCLVPKNDIFQTDLKWQKQGYSSNNYYHKTYAIQIKDHIFIGSFVDNSLFIQRTTLPDIYGKIDSTNDLVTPKADFYFEKNSNFLEVFQTKYEVYFVVVEPVSAKSLCISYCPLSSASRIVYVTRLIRICKNDFGGLNDHNKQNFGTIAKADLICPVGTEINEFRYTKAVSASWANGKLYVLFENQRNSPPGKVVCYYDDFAFNNVFDGQIRPPLIIPNSQHIDLQDNPLPKVCQIINDPNINLNVKTIASSLSLNGLYRVKNIQPVNYKPIINFKNKHIKLLKSFPVSHLDSSTLIVLSDDKFVEIYSHNENNEICFINKYKLKELEIVNQISGTNLSIDVLVVLSTNQRVIQMKLNNCHSFESESKCLSHAPNICGWDKRTTICTTLNENIDNTRWKRSSCKKSLYDSKWSESINCQVNDSQISLTCICKYCMDKSMCKNEPEVQITDCSGSIQTGKWSEWEKWSECSPTDGYKRRKRVCQSQLKCLGSSEESILCDRTNKIETKTAWTQWYSNTQRNFYNSFRAKCSLSQLEAIPILENREMYCESFCPDHPFKWSKWSDCISQQVQYRLYNCSTISQCPADKIQMQHCKAMSKSLQNNQNEKETTFTTIHLVLAILVASIIWLFILIFISIILLRCKFQTRLETSKRKKKIFYQDTPLTLKRQFSETSNDYLSSDLKSTICDLDHRDLSFVHTNNNNNINIASTSNNLYTSYPLISDQHSNKAPI